MLVWRLLYDEVEELRVSSFGADGSSLGREETNLMKTNQTLSSSSSSSLLLGGFEKTP